MAAQESDVANALMFLNGIVQSHLRNHNALEELGTLFTQWNVCMTNVALFQHNDIHNNSVYL